MMLTPPPAPNVVIFGVCQAILAILTNRSSGKKIYNSTKNVYTEFVEK